MSSRQGSPGFGDGDYGEDRYAANGGVNRAMRHRQGQDSPNKTAIRTKKLGSFVTVGTAYAISSPNPFEWYRDSDGGRPWRPRVDRTLFDTRQSAEDALSVLQGGPDARAGALVVRISFKRRLLT